MHKKRSNKHSKRSKSNTFDFRGGHSLINKISKSKFKNTNNDTSHHSHTDSVVVKLPPLKQLDNISTNNNSNSISNNNHTSPSTSNTYYTQKCIRLDTSTIHSISSDVNYTGQIPHSPSASYSFSETNNSSTNVDCIVMIEPQTQQNSSINTHTNPFHPQTQKHFYPTSSSTTHTINNRPHSTSQIKTFKFDDIQNINNTKNKPISQSHTERFQQLQPDPSSTQMTPTPSPSAPNWNNITNSITSSSSPMYPISLNSNSNIPNPDGDFHLTPKPRKYGSRSHLIDENENETNNNNKEQVNNNKKRDSIKNVKIGQTMMHPYRVYNEANIYANNGPESSINSIKSVNSISSAVSIDSFDTTSNSYNPLPQNYGNYKPKKMTTCTAHSNIKNIHIKLTPTTSTPITTTSPHNNSLKHKLHNVKWQTYIGHFVFHEHDRGHSLYHTFKKIGEGVFARVYKTIRKEPQRTVALKVFPKKNRYAEGSFANELMLLHNVSHPNIVKLYDAHVDPKYFYLEMEVCRGGDIFKHISRKGRIDEIYVRQIIYKIVDAIRCFHERDFVHRDLKPENIVFVQQNDISDIRLIDFGESIHIEPQEYYNEFVGTPCYFAPERYRQHTGAELKKCDVWAIGVIMFEMLTGCRCFKGGDNTWEIKHNILNKKMEQFPPDLILSSNAMDFFNKLLEYEPLKRYSCQQALRHDWLYDIFQQKQMNNYINTISPRLTPVTDTNGQQSIDVMQAIVIRTSQSMTNLQNIFKQEINNRYNTNIKYKRKKGDEKNEKNENENEEDEDEDEDEDDDDDGQVPSLKFLITRKKSRSLEQNELRATLRNKDGTSFHRLTLPKHGDKYRIKHRSHTLGSKHDHSHTSHRHKKEEKEKSVPIHAPGPPLIKHQKSLSSPMNNKLSNKYHPSPVHEDHEHNDSIISNSFSNSYTDNIQLYNV